MKTINRQTNHPGLRPPLLEKAGSFLPSLRSAVKQGIRRLMVLVRRYLRVTEPAPEKLINDIARRNGLVAFLVPRELPGQVAATAVIYSLAEQAGLVVTLACPTQNLGDAIKRRIQHTQHVRNN